LFGLLCACRGMRILRQQIPNECIYNEHIMVCLVHFFYKFRSMLLSITVKQMY
jgi:hypothetical protein